MTAKPRVTWLAWLVYQKVWLLTPLDRIRRDLAERGVPLAMSTLVSFIERAADLLSGVDGLRWKQLLSSSWMATDGTGLKVIVPKLLPRTRKLGLADVALREHRQRFIRPIAHDFERWLDAVEPTLLPSEPLAAAVGYYENHREGAPSSTRSPPHCCWCPWTRCSCVRSNAQKQRNELGRVWVGQRTEPGARGCDGAQVSGSAVICVGPAGVARLGDRTMRALGIELHPRSTAFLGDVSSLHCRRAMTVDDTTECENEPGVRPRSDGLGFRCVPSPHDARFLFPKGEFELGRSAHAVELDRFAAALRQTKGNVRAAASIGGVSRARMYRIPRGRRPYELLEASNAAEPESKA